MQPILTPFINERDSYTLDFYLKRQDGYQALEKAIGMAPADVIEEVKKSGLRGRGGAGFPTGMKWQFVQKDSPKPKYICCNADESEPGTFKDHVLMERNPHLLIEGCLIACHAIGAKAAYIYIRGEFYHVQRRLEAEIDAARKAGYIGRNIMGTGFDCEVHIFRGAGAYEAGEETALIESLEGKRAQPRIKPPFPAVAGLWQSPSAVNNVETLCNVPFIVRNGAAAFAALGPEKNGGPKLFCVSGHVERPGTYETTMSTTLRELIYDPKFGGGIPGGRKLKCVIPGGSSVPVLLPDQLDIPASFDGVAAAGSMLGSAGIIVMDDTTCMVWAAENLLHFYQHESCGKCTPCREGTDWLLKLLEKVEHGEGQMEDIELLMSVGNNIAGKTLCAFGDAAATPVLTTITTFRHEYEEHVRRGGCPYPADWRMNAKLETQNSKLKTRDGVGA
ncbi:MAG: NADH-quinone oxidoreductase subunit NuoF [Vicinamibacterales bacterium]